MGDAHQNQVKTPTQNQFHLVNKLSARFEFDCKPKLLFICIKAYPNSEAELQIGEILIGLLQALQFNAHEIYETKAFESQQNVGGKKMMYVGAAIYNSAVYFNHSCYPDVIRYFVGTTIVLCTSHPLQPGDNISENYGPIFTKQTLPVRQKHLQSRYWFKCACIACKENWPTLDKLTNKARLR